MTTASSTSMPSTMTMPSSTEMLSVKPMADSAQNAAASENGMPSPTRMAMREPRNSQVIKSTSARPNSALVSMMSMAWRVGMVWSSSSTTVSPLLASMPFLAAR